MAARNSSSQQASVTWQSNNQQSRGSEGAACWHCLAASVIKPNDGKQQDTISAQRRKIKLCNESTDVICTLSVEERRRDSRRKIEAEGESHSLRIDREVKKCVNSAVLVMGRSVAIVAFSVGMHDSTKLFFLLSCYVYRSVSYGNSA